MQPIQTTTDQVESQDRSSQRALKKALERVGHVKRRLRPKYSAWEWYTFDFYNNFGPYTMFQENVQRIDEAVVSCDEFAERFEKGLQPVVIQGATGTWRAHVNWTLERLSERYGTETFRCNSHSAGINVRIKMKYFLLYAEDTHDDSPLAICDSSFGEHYRRQALLADYSVPKYFRDDLMKYARQSQRPVYRWFVVAPARSGTSLSIQRLGLGRWSALVHGQRRWCLFPNGTPKELLKIARGEFDKFRHEPSIWFRIVYPSVHRHEWPAEFRPAELLQIPGEVVYVPPGWWYIVLNLEFCCGVEQTVCSPANFPWVYPKVKCSKPNFARNWLEKLRKKRPSVIECVTALGARALPNNWTLQDNNSDTSSSLSSAPSLCYDKKYMSGSSSSPCTDQDTTSYSTTSWLSPSSLDSEELQEPPYKRQRTYELNDDDDESLIGEVCDFSTSSDSSDEDSATLTPHIQAQSCDCFHLSDNETSDDNDESPKTEIAFNEHNENETTSCAKIDEAGEETAEVPPESHSDKEQASAESELEEGELVSGDDIDA